jgi:hypothetical protein
VLSNGSIAPCSGKAFISDRAFIFKCWPFALPRRGGTAVELLKEGGRKVPLSTQEGES